MSRNASEEHVSLKISEHTLAERDYSHASFAGKRFENAVTYIIVTLAVGVIIGMGNYVTTRFIESPDDAAKVEQAYGK